MKNILFMILLLVSSSAVLFAQEITVSGVVMDANTNNPVDNATVRLKNSNIFTITDASGKFTLNASSEAVLIISHINYHKKILEVSSVFIEIILQPKSINLDDIIVKANVLQDISQSNVIVDNTKATTQPRNVGDLFKDIKGFGIQKRGAYASEPVFRAFRYEQLNVQYDGGMKVLNACPNRMDPITTHIIPDEIEKIEIVRGPFTVRFGQNFGGIINLVTKKHSTFKNGLSGSVGSGYEVNGDNLSTHGNLKFKSDKFDININGEYRNYGNYEDGNGIEVPSSFNTTDYSIKAGYEPTAKQRFQLSWRQSFGRDIVHAGLPMDSPYDDSYLIGLDYKITDLSDIINAVSVKGFYSYVDHLMTNEGRPSFMMTEASSNVFATTYGGKAELVISPNENTFIFTGIDANLIGREGNRIRLVKVMNGNMLPEPRTFIDKIWQDSKVNDIGVFAESSLKLSDDYTFTAGLRSDFISSSINDPEQDFLDLYGGNIGDTNETNISGNISIKYKSNDLQIQLALGRGIRTASMIERYINHFSVGVDPYEYVGNPNLDAEKNNQIELSFSKNFDRIEMGSSLFYSLIQDNIVPVVDESIPRKFMPGAQPQYAKRFINIDEATQAGFELYWNYEITDNFKFSSDVSYTYAQNKEFDEPLPQITPLTAHAALNYQRKNYWINLNSRFVAAQHRISTTFMEQASDDFATFDFSIGVEPIKNLIIGASILNIFDTAYYEHLNFSYKNSNTLSGRIYEPGRNFTFRVNYKF